MTQEDIISEIEAFAAARGIAPSTVTSKAVSNSRLYERLKRGGGCTLRTAEKIRAFMIASSPVSETGEGAPTAPDSRPAAASGHAAAGDPTGERAA